MAQTLILPLGAVLLYQVTLSIVLTLGFFTATFACSSLMRSFGAGILTRWMRYLGTSSTIVAGLLLRSLGLFVLMFADHSTWALVFSILATSVGESLYWLRMNTLKYELFGVFAKAGRTVVLAQAVRFAAQLLAGVTVIVVLKDSTQEYLVLLGCVTLLLSTQCLGGLRDVKEMEIIQAKAIWDAFDWRYFFVFFTPHHRFVHMLVPLYLLQTGYSLQTSAAVLLVGLMISLGLSYVSGHLRDRMQKDVLSWFALLLSPLLFLMYVYASTPIHFVALGAVYSVLTQIQIVARDVIITKSLRGKQKSQEFVLLGEIGYTLGVAFGSGIILILYLVYGSLSLSFMLPAAVLVLLPAALTTRGYFG